MADDFLPYFNFYAAETLADEWFDVAAFDDRGLWLTLLLKIWVNGSIPADPDEIAKLLHADAVAFRPLWERIKGRFIPHPELSDRLTSRRLEAERAKATKKVKGAKKAAKLRWAKAKSKTAAGMRPYSEGTADAMPTDQINTDQRNTEQIKPQGRAARVGVGHPAFEAVQHWTQVVWPKLSTAKPLPVSTPLAQQLASLCSQVTPAEVIARMDRAAADPYWRDKLTLDVFLDNPDRWAERKAGPTGKPNAVAPAQQFTTTRRILP